MSKVKVTDIDATGRTLEAYLRGDGTWAVPSGSGGGLPAGGSDGSLIRREGETGAEWFDPNQDGFTSGGGLPYGTHRYWRIFVTANREGSGTGKLSEIEMRETPGGPDVTTGGTPIGTGNPANAFDGSLNAWGSGGIPTDCWVGYDFGNEVSILQLRLNLGDSLYTEPWLRVDKGHVQYSDTGLDWVTAWSFDNTTDSNDFLSTSPTLVSEVETGWLAPSGGNDGEVLVKNSAADGDFKYKDFGAKAEPTATGPSGLIPAGALIRKFWELNILTNTDGNPGTSTMLAEIQFRSEPGVPQLVGPGVATTSSYLEANVPSRAFDNNLGTFWHTAGTNVCWIRYEYNEPISVQEVSITLRDGGASVAGAPKTFYVRCSNDGIEWENAWFVEDAGWTNNAQNKVFTNPDAADLVNYYPTNLRALNDVDMTTVEPEDGDVPVWDAATQKWRPGAGGGGGGGGLPSGGQPGYLIENIASGEGDWVDPANGLGGNPGNSSPYGSHAYWRVQSTSQGDNRYALVAELIFRTLAGGTRIPSVGTAIEGGHYGDNVAARAFDGNPDSVWESQNQDNTGPGTLWVGFHYDDPVSVAEVVIQVHPSYETDERPLAGNIQYSDNGTQWTTAWTFAGLTYPGNQQTLTSPAYIAPTGRMYLLPAGGDLGQVPVKASAADGDFEWADQTGGGGGLVGTGSWAPPIAYFSRVANQPVTNGVWAAVAFDTVVRDDLNVRDAANPGRIYVPEGVTRVRLTAFVTFSGSQGGNKYFAFSKNSDGQGPSFIQVSKASAWQSGETLISGWVDCEEGDYFTLVVTAETSGIVIHGTEPALPNQHSYLQVEFDDHSNSLGPVEANTEVSARIDCSNPNSPVLAGGVNVASVAKTGTGLYRVTFTEPIDPSKVGFNGGGKWATATSGRATLVVGIDRVGGNGLTSTTLDISTSADANGTYFDCDDWFSFTLYDVTQPSAKGGVVGGGGTPSPLWTGGVPDTPKAADFAVVKSTNDFAITLHEEDDGVHLEFGIGGNPASDRTAFLERPTGGLVFDFQTLLVGQNVQRQYQSIGVAVRNSSNGRFVTFGIGEGDNRGYNILKWNSPGSYNNSYFNNTRPMPAWPLWMRARGDGTTLYFYMSSNGKYWTLVFGLPFADFVGAADRVGIHYVASQVSAPQNVEEHLHIMAWRQT